MTKISSYQQKKRRQLLQEKARLEKELSKLADESNGAHSDEDNAQILEQFQGNLALKSNLSKLLDDAKGALAKIGQGSYGICELCQTEIPNERLDIQPASLICVGCETKRGKKRWWLLWRK